MEPELYLVGGEVSDALVSKFLTSISSPFFNDARKLKSLVSSSSSFLVSCFDFNISKYPFFRHTFPLVLNSSLSIETVTETLLNSAGG